MNSWAGDHWVAERSLRKQGLLPGFRRATPQRHCVVAQCLQALPCPFIGLLDVKVWRRGAGGRLPQALQAAGQRDKGGQAQAFVIEMVGSCPADLAELRQMVCEMLKTLGSNASRVVERDQWWFAAGSGAWQTMWFTTVHAGLYPAGHARHWPLEWPVVTMVPSWIFREVLPDGANAHTRRIVRQAFADEGLRYARQGGAIAGID